jgi:hypothetical protein
MTWEYERKMEIRERIIFRSGGKRRKNTILGPKHKPLKRSTMAEFKPSLSETCTVD